MENTFKAWFLSFVHLFFPRQCAVCGSSLQEGEEGICIRCNMNMPRTNYHLREDNSVERMFWGKIPLERGTSFFYYHKGSDFRHILHQLKYGGRKDLGEIMGLFHKRTLDAYMKTKKTMKRLLSGIKKPPNTIIARNLIMHKAA